MSKYSGREYEDQRPHSKIKIIKREISRGRMPRKSPQQHSIRERKRRLDDLQTRIAREPDAKKKEPLFKQYAHLVVSCPHEVLKPDEIQGIEKYSSLNDNNLLRSLGGNVHQGPRPDFLPLHYLVKLLDKKVPGDASDRYVYLLGSTSTSTINEASARNLRGLEYFLLDFAHRLPAGQFLDLEIDGRRIQVENHDRSYHQDNNAHVIKLRRRLSAVGIKPSEEYTLRRIRDGHTKIQATLHILEEQRAYNDQNTQETIAFSYLTNSVPIKQR